MSRHALTAEVIFDGEAMRRDVAVVIDGARIEKVVPVQSADAPIRDLGPGMLVPGFIDAQVNGGGGVLLNETPTLEGVRAIAAAHRRFGTTGLLPTVITDAQDVMEAAAGAVAEAIRYGVPGVLGIHIEGPFIDPARKGAHAEKFIRRPADKDIDWLCNLKCGRILLTLAPNCVTPEHIKRLAMAGVIVSLGHSGATAEVALAAIDAGARGFTHLFNAMSQLNGRAPGMVGAALTHPEAYCGVIADGAHVHPMALCAALNAKPQGRLFFVSDAMPSAASGPLAFSLQGRPVHVEEGRLLLADGTLAGSHITMADAVDYGRQVLGLKNEDALNMASRTPAAFLGLDQQLGRITSGYRATMVLLRSGGTNKTYKVLATWIDGQMTDGMI